MRGPKYGYDSGRKLGDLASYRRALAPRQSLVSLADKVATSLIWTIFHPVSVSFLDLFIKVGLQVGIPWWSCWYASMG